MKSELEENLDDISRIVTEANNCFCLLVPKPENLFGESSVNETENELHEKLDFREHGLQGPSGSIAIHLNEHVGRIKRTEDNSAIIDNLQELCLLLKTRYMPLIKKWVQIASKASK